MLNQLAAFASGPRPIQTQLCVGLANLAIQMTSWKDVLATVGSTLGSNAGDCVLEFLKILPEEVTEGRKINLSVRSIDHPPIQLASARASATAYIFGMGQRV
jgi:transportin-3